jgi:hypothetical protein
MLFYNFLTVGASSLAIKIGDVNNGRMFSLSIISCYRKSLAEKFMQILSNHQGYEDKRVAINQFLKVHKDHLYEDRISLQSNIVYNDYRIKNKSVFGGGIQNICLLVDFNGEKLVGCKLQRKRKSEIHIGSSAITQLS